MKDEAALDSLTIPELKEALRLATVAIRKHTWNPNRKIDVVGFDACYMSMGEVAHEIRDYAEIMIGAEGLEPAFGWPYRRILASAKTARELDVSPQTVLGLSARIGRHCLLFHERHRPRGELREPLTLDSFVSFEWSQYHPTHFHLVVGQQSHYIHGFTDSEVRRSGSMRPEQHRRRARLEARHRRPDPRSVEDEVASPLGIVTAGATRLVLHTDEHSAYPRALARQRHLREVEHHTVSSRARRDTRNPLFPINLVDLLIRQQREPQARDHRVQAPPERGGTAVAAGGVAQACEVVLRAQARRAPRGARRGERPAPHAARHPREAAVPGRIRLPERWARHYWRLTPTRCIPRVRTHTLRYAA